MQLLENIPCSLCNSQDYKTIYTSTQYANSSLTAMNISLVICNKCNFIFQNPQLTNEALAKHYATNSSGETYTQRGRNTRTNNLLIERVKFITESIQNISISNICDVGAGKGLLIESLRIDKKIKKYIIEPSSALYQCTNPNIVKINKFIEDIDSNSVKFDFLMCISALEHFKDPLGILKKFYNLIDKNGFLLIEIPNSLKPYKTFAEFFSYEHLNHFTIETIIKFLNKAGFYPVKIEESQVVPNIRILAKKSDIDINHKNIIEVFNIYTQNKNQLKENLEIKINNLKQNNQLKNLGIYGAGNHTKFILESFDLLDNIIVFIDSDPKKSNLEYYGRKIISPEEIELYPIENILISSYDFEKEIFNSLCKILKKDIHIITLYDK